MELNIEGLTQEQIDAVNKLVQSHEDRIRTDYSKKLKDVQTELDQYKPKQKSESELAIEQRIANLEAKEQELASKERAMTIADKLKAKGLVIQCMMIWESILHLSRVGLMFLPV